MDTLGLISAAQRSSSCLECDVKDVSDGHIFSTPGEGSKEPKGKSGHIAQPVCTGNSHGIISGEM